MRGSRRGWEALCSDRVLEVVAPKSVLPLKGLTLKLLDPRVINLIFFLMLSKNHSQLTLTCGEHTHTHMCHVSSH